jgi:branched-chain amino acid transport system substrate-binding protein
MKIHRTLLAGALVAAGLLSPAAHAQIKIGFMAELSGPQGALGQDQYDAFMMVVEQNGGKLGGVPVQVLKEDSQLKPRSRRRSSTS